MTKWQQAQERYRIAPHGTKTARLKELRRITTEMLKAEIARRAA